VDQSKAVQAIGSPNVYRRHGQLGMLFITTSANDELLVVSASMTLKDPELSK